MTVSMVVGLPPWLASINDPQYLAAKRAIRTGGTSKARGKTCLGVMFRGGPRLSVAKAEPRGSVRHCLGFSTLGTGMNGELIQILELAVPFYLLILGAPNFGKCFTWRGGSEQRGRNVRKEGGRDVS